jgi:hypothetical protein
MKRVRARYARYSELQRQLLLLEAGAHQLQGGERHPEEERRHGADLETEAEHRQPLSQVERMAYETVGTAGDGVPSLGHDREGAPQVPERPDAHGEPADGDRHPLPGQIELRRHL